MKRFTVTGFSPKQQIVLAICCLCLGLFLGAASWRATRQTLAGCALAAPVPDDIGFLIDPPVHINTAGAEELQLLPSVGPILAERIVAYRETHGPFSGLEELDRVRGIGPKTIRQLRHYLNRSDFR